MLRKIWGWFGNLFAKLPERTRTPPQKPKEGHETVNGNMGKGDDIGIYEGDYLKCPLCNHQNNVGSSFVQDGIVCEHCQKYIVNPKATKFDYTETDILNRAFQMVDDQK